MIDALTDTPLSSVSVRVSGVGEGTSGGDGSFSIQGGDGDGLREVRLSSGATVERVTHMRVPGPDARVTLMPNRLDLRAFDEMVRASGHLQRWTFAPRLVVQTRVLKFTSTTDTEFTGTAQTMSDAEANGVFGDLAHGLPQITAFGSFASQELDRGGEGASISVSRHGYIIIARYEGLKAATGFEGYARWAASGGEVVRGIIMLDKDFDASGSPYRRALRIHELGHALGYSHVSARDSFMNAEVRFEPNGFDRDASRFAFLRPPLNRSPDIDPDPYSANVKAGGPLVWKGSK